jgi:CTP:molybdopterin cytidylyltransferase MocA
MVTGVVLAAGSGTRIGYPKALLQTSKAGQCFAARACEVLDEAGVHHIVLVTSQPCAAALRDLLPRQVEIATNPDPNRGQISSLQCALARVTPGPRAVVVLPVDVPLVRSATIRRLIETWQASSVPVVRPARGDRHGHPVLFDRGLFVELARADLSDGAKSIVRAHVSPAGEVAVDDDGAFTDIDSAEDYWRAFHRAPTLVQPARGNKT